jgi:peptidoglycan hydrolase-like protein with peptidoglycan-binding domain
MASYLTRNLLGVFVMLALVQPGWAAGTEAAPKGMERAKTHVVKTSDDVKKLQEALKAKGDDPGVIDGVMGKKTIGALKGFQERNGLKATGKLDKQTAEKLGIEMAESTTSR